MLGLAERGDTMFLIMFVAAAGSILAGCTKCGPIWDDCVQRRHRIERAGGGCRSRLAATPAML
jgi:hypothetical protein